MAQGIRLDIDDIGKLAGVCDGHSRWSTHPGVVRPAKLPTNRNSDRLFPAIGSELVCREQPILAADVVIDIIVAAPSQGEQKEDGKGRAFHG